MSNVVGGRPPSLITLIYDSITARRIGGPAYPEMIEEIDKELTKVIEDFDRAMNFETLHLVNKTKAFLFSIHSTDDPQGFSTERAAQEQAERERVEQELLFRRLKPVETGYHRDLCCM